MGNKSEKSRKVAHNAYLRLKTLHIWPYMTQRQTYVWDLATEIHHLGLLGTFNERALASRASVCSPSVRMHDAGYFAHTPIFAPHKRPQNSNFYIIFQVIYISLVFSHTKSSYKNLYWYKSILPSTKSTGRPKYHFSHSVFETPLFPTVTPATHNI